MLELRRDADAAQVLSQLFSETDLQVSLSFQMVYLFGEPMQAARQPKQVGISELLNYWNAHQVDVLTRRAQFDLRKAQERLHIVEGLIVGAANAERIAQDFPAGGGPGRRRVRRSRRRISSRLSNRM